MHAGQIVENVENILEAGAHVIGIEYRVPRHLAQSRRPVGQHVRQRAHRHPEVPIEGPHASDSLRTVVIETE